MSLRVQSFCLVAAVLAAGCQGAVGAKMNNLVPPGETADAAEPSDEPPPPDAGVNKPDKAAVAPDLAPDVAPDLPPPPDAGPVWARGVKVGLVEAAQAVFIEIGTGDTVKPSIDRNAPLIEGRALFLRAHVVTETGWTARRLRAVLSLEVGDQKTELEDAKMIAGPSDTEKLESSFNFLVPAMLVKPKTELSVSVYETGPGAGAEPATPPRFPPMGTADLGVKAGKMVMDVVMVMMEGPSGPLDDSPARRKRLESYLGDVYPVQKLVVRWRPPIKITAKIGWMDAFMTLQKARIDDDAKPAEYYHMLLAKEDSLDAFLGLGRIAGPAAGEGANRIAMTNVSKHAVDGEMDTVSHEMGHNLGRNHAPGCKAQGVDDHFPYPETGVGVDGYSIPEAAFKSRKKWKDVMGYCYPTWISDYTWNGFERRTRVVSAYSETMPFQPLAARSLQGFQAPGTAGRWGVVAGTLVVDQAITATRQARITLASGERQIAPIDVSLLRSPAGPEESARQISVNLPDEEIASVEVIVDGERLAVPASALVAP
jgi:hypothetical protein